MELVILFVAVLVIGVGVSWMLHRKRRERERSAYQSALYESQFSRVQMPTRTVPVYRPTVTPKRAEPRRTHDSGGGYNSFDAAGTSPYPTHNNSYVPVFSGFDGGHSGGGGASHSFDSSPSCSDHSGGGFDGGGGGDCGGGGGGD